MLHFFLLLLYCQTIFPIKTFTYVCGTFTEELDLHQNVMFMLQLKQPEFLKISRIILSYTHLNVLNWPADVCRAKNIKNKYSNKPATTKGYKRIIRRFQEDLATLNTFNLTFHKKFCLKIFLHFQVLSCCHSLPTLFTFFCKK